MGYYVGGHKKCHLGSLPPEEISRLFQTWGRGQDAISGDDEGPTFYKEKRLKEHDDAV